MAKGKEPVLSDGVGKQLCEALGIDPSMVASVTVELTPRRPAIMHVKIFPGRLAMDVLRKSLREAGLEIKLSQIAGPDVSMRLMPVTETDDAL